ncbi:MAG: hypothetical protein IJW82_05020 [Clostridia bacterium]|nr:hypothetical protein [Clostridia bacterium]
MENKRYAELNKLIKKWHEEGQDKHILQSLYNQSNLSENFEVDRSEDIKQTTMFSDLTDLELLERYEKKYFNKYTNRELKHLFQESHNRFMKDSNLQVTRNVVVKNNTEKQHAIGWVSSSQDYLYMNKYFINRGKEQKDQNEIINERSIGKIVLKTLLHETKHNIQYEDAIDFALGNKQEQDRAFAGALMMINNTNFNLAAAQSDEEYERYVKHWKDNYNYHAYEQEANYAANERVVKLYGLDYKNMKPDYAQALAQNAFAVFRFRPSGDPKMDKTLLADRVDKIEEYTKSQLEYFEKGAKDCPLKSRVSETMHAYIDVDEKGNSPLRTRLTRELDEMYEQYTKSIDYLRKIKSEKEVEQIQDNMLLNF